MTEPDRERPELHIERDFPIAPEELFRIWADPGRIRQWWGPRNFSCTEFEADFRVGGVWRAIIVNPDWGESGMHGAYREIVPGERLVFTFTWAESDDQPALETLVTVMFTPIAEGCRQSFHQAPFADEESRDSHVEGWNECFDKENDYISTIDGESA